MHNLSPLSSTFKNKFRFSYFFLFFSLSYFVSINKFCLQKSDTRNFDICTNLSSPFFCWKLKISWSSLRHRTRSSQGRRYRGKKLLFNEGRRQIFRFFFYDPSIIVTLFRSVFISPSVMRDNIAIFSSLDFRHLLFAIFFAQFFTFLLLFVL